MGFSLAPANRFDAQCETGFTFEPLTPAGEPIGASITVRGPESATVRAHLRRQIAVMQARELAAKRRGAEVEPQTMEDMEAQAIDLAVAYTVGWQGIEDEAGKPVAFSETAARQLFGGWSWIRRQVIEQAQDLGNFVRPGRASSSTTPAPNLP